MLDPSSRQRVVSAFTLSRIDFCNAVLAALPAWTLAPFQRVLNAAARFVAGLPANAHITDTMRSLHWLPVAYRIHYKLCLVMYAVYNGISPSYVADTTTGISTIPGRGKLRSVKPAISTYLAPEQNSETERQLSLWQDHENGMLCRSRSETSPKYLRSSVL